MPAASPKAAVLLVSGEDEFGVKERAREVFKTWSAEIGGTDHEIIDASVSNSGEALAALAKLREALQTLPFFGTGKVVWLQNCNFLGEERAASAQAVTEDLAELSQTLKTFVWQNVRLLISAGKVDKRKTIYKTLEKIGSVEIFAGWSAEDKDWAVQAESFALRALGELGKEISDEGLSKLVVNAGPNARGLRSEIEKLSLYVGERPRIEVGDVDAIVTRNKQARAFALGDALGDRNLPRLLRCLDEELWEARRDPQRNEIGLLYGLISKVRVLILAREMLAQKWLKPETDFSRFRSQLARVPSDALPEDKKFNPLAMNPYVLFRAVGQARNYTQAELVGAMDLLLECNQKLISRSLDPSLVLQQALVRIVSRPAETTGKEPLAAAA
ncbi:MAG TPA: DNA polymerase III subunit delta [Verrucomicrobiae bacterium]|jgi:DNA polymerase-3 subunit delta|nr:DNA polymerase III subunit delta [Verrucomicrobiae bacterium]